MEALEDHLLAQLERSRDFFWHRLRFRALLCYLPEDRPFTLVDVGAGAGLLGDWLGRRLPQARYGFVEPLESLRRVLVERHGREADFQDRHPYDGVDFVALMDVIEHIEDDRGFLFDLTDRMRPGARLLVTVPAMKSLWSGWDVALGHFRRHDKSTFAKLCEGLPFRILESSYLHPEMVPLGWFRKLRRPTATASAGDVAQFPDISRFGNHLLYGVGLPSLLGRRWSPIGTTLFTVLERLDG